MDEACPLDTSCDLLHHLDSPSLSSELQDNSSVDSVEIEFLPESEGQLDHTKHSPTDVFSEHRDYELFLLQKVFDAPNDNPNHYVVHNLENQDNIVIHATNLSNIFALSQFMAHHNFEGQDPTDAPSAVQTASQFTCGHTLQPKCAHNPMETQCNQSQHDPSSLASPKGEMKCSFSWTSLFKSPISSTLCFGEPTLGKLNQVKLLCSISSSSLWDHTHAKSNQETELCITKHIPLCDSAGHTGIPFPTPRSSFEANRVSNSLSILVTTPSSRMILGKPKIEVTKGLTHNNGKNGEHFYGDNWHSTTKNGENSDCNSRLVTKNLLDHAVRNGKQSCAPFNLNNISCRFLLKEVDWGGRHQINFVVNWQSHETYPTGHNISEVDWGALHYSSFFIFLVNIDYDAKSKDFFTQELWGGLPERTYSTTHRNFNHVEGKLIHHLELQTGPRRLDHQLDEQRGPPHLHPVHSMKVVTTDLTNGILGRNLCSLNSSGKLLHPRSFTSYGLNLNTISVAC